jgi:GT2 family glycosyltransferase/glycosyltransferase involved in cell wall biosynthesis
MNSQHFDANELLKEIHVTLETGDLFKARTLCADGLSQDPENPLLIEALGAVCNEIGYSEAKRRFTGTDYRQWLYLFHRTIRPEAYLEIGIDKGDTLGIAEFPTLAIGIDPEYHITAQTHSNTRLFKTTSDQFFIDFDAQNLLAEKKIDLAFIDGLHTFDQALRDFINIEKVSHHKTIVLAHDVFPVEPITALRNRITQLWVGDTWKIVPILLKYRPDLRISTIPTYPSGLAVISNLDPQSTILDEQYRAIVDEYMSKLDDKLLNVEDYLNVSSNDPKTVFSSLGFDNWDYPSATAPANSNSQDSARSKYHKWLESRAAFFHGHAFKTDAPDADQKEISVLFFVRATSEQLSLLADTIDSLIGQNADNWHLEIYCDSPAPEVIESIPCISWTNFPPDYSFKNSIDARTNANWIMEIAAGTRLDPILTQRLSLEAQNNPDALCFFSDDDLIDATGVRNSPRFKFGANPTALLTSDLSGPICIRRDAWFAVADETTPGAGPWFSQLLRISEKFGWDAIKHIPDVLVTHPERFPCHVESCITALTQHFLRTKTEAEIVPVTNHSWNIRYRLPEFPPVSVAIISTGQLGLLSRCLDSIVEKTDYPDFEIIISLTDRLGDTNLDDWIRTITQRDNPKIRVVQTNPSDNFAARCNAAVQASPNDFVLLISESAVIIQEKWLDDLVRTAAQPGIGGVSPRLIQPNTCLIENVGSVLGLNGIAKSPYQDLTKLGSDLGYLECIHIARDVSALPASCMLVRKESYLLAGGMNATELGDHFAETDLCLKLRKNGQRLVFQPLANVANSDMLENNFESDPIVIAQTTLTEARAKATFHERWYPAAATDPFWNPGLSIAEGIPGTEPDLISRWQFTPGDLPRIFAHTIPNAQGDYRVISPLKALSQHGMVSECIVPQDYTKKNRKFSAAEIIRLNPDSVIVQNFIHNRQLSMLQEWNASGCSPFIIYGLDDLITGLDSANPFFQNIPANARTRLQYALKRCNRLVVSTEYLANAYQGLIADIRIVPNRLEQMTWLPLRSLRRTGKKPRIGWAGGCTHGGDLLVLKEIITQTRDEADWIFFGMCPEEIRPLLAEYHGPVPFQNYPAYLASLNFDLAVAPLAEITFNRGRSNLRLLEYGILGIPVVCTDIEPYRNSPACRVSNTVAAWTDAIRARIHNPEAREQEGDAMRRWVLDNYLLENHLEDWLKAHLPD